MHRSPAWQGGGGQPDGFGAEAHARQQGVISGAGEAGAGIRVLQARPCALPHILCEVPGREIDLDVLGPADVSGQAWAWGCRDEAIT